MTAFTVSAAICRPPEMVDAAFMRLENHPKFTADLESVEVVEDTPGKVGSRARLHYRDGSVMNDHLDVCLPGQLYRSRVSNEGMVAHVETRLLPIEGGTRVSITWDGTSTSLIGKAVLALMKSKIRRRALEDLMTFKHLVEEHGPEFPSA